MYLYNVTLANNTADSDLDGFGDGGGVGNGGFVYSRNSLLGGNVDTGGEAPDFSGTLISQGYNLIQSTIGYTITGVLTGNLTGVDPLLGPLENNGGSTLTHALLPGSPAIDAGNPTGCTDHLGNLLTTDQRGVTRPQGPTCDIGAVELALLNCEGTGTPLILPFKLFLPLILRGDTSPCP